MTSAIKQPQITIKRRRKLASVPQLPHERDESDDSPAGAPREDMHQAYLDIEHGLVDTDCHGMRGIEKVRKNR